MTNISRKKIIVAITFILKLFVIILLDVIAYFNNYSGNYQHANGNQRLEQPQPRISSENRPVSGTKNNPQFNTTIVSLSPVLHGDLFEFHSSITGNQSNKFQHWIFGKKYGTVIRIPVTGDISFHGFQYYGRFHYPMDGKLPGISDNRQRYRNASPRKSRV